MATRNVLSRPCSRRVLAPSVIVAPVRAPAVSPPPITSNVRFQNIEDLHMHSRSWETTTRIVSGRIRESRSGNVSYRAILIDLSGDKMDAVAYGQQAYRFNDELQIGEIYLFRGLGFEMAEGPPRFGLAIPNAYYILMHCRTQIHLLGPNISIPRLPSMFMEFSDVARLRNKMLTNVIGIVVHVSPVRFHRSFERSTPCRDVVLLNMRREFICLRIWDRHVSRHMTKWRRAEQEMCILAGTLLEVSAAQGALKTIDESHIIFEPDNELAYELEDYRLTLGPSCRSILRRVKAFVRHRLTMGYYTNLRLGRL